MTDPNEVTPVALMSASLRLTALPTAVGISRRFVRHNLTRWKLEEYSDVAELIMSELVTNAVKVSGVVEPNPKPWRIKPEHVVGVQLRAIGSSAYIEVWDRIDSLPVVKNPNLAAEGGRGLLLVEQLAMTWNVYRPRVGGKIVWAQLALAQPVESLSSDEVSIPLQASKDMRAMPGPTDDVARTAMFEQLLETTATAICARVNGAT